MPHLVGVRHLLMLTPVLDAADPVQGFAIGWVNALAALVPRVTAVGLRLGDGSALAPNVAPIGLGRPDAGRGRVAARLARLALHTDADACLVHMNWPMLLAAGPALRARGIPTALWWAHGRVPPGLRLAQNFAALLLTSSSTACRIGGSKRRVLGQGIETDRFLPAAAEPAGPPIVLCAGRIAPVKRIGLVEEACARAGLALRVVGPSPSPLAGEGWGGGCGGKAGLSGNGTPRGTTPLREFWRPVSHAAMPDVLRAAHIFATASDTGSPDKAALEAMACALPVVALGEGLRGALPDDLAAQVIVPDVAAMAGRLAALAAMTPDLRRAFGLRLREAVVAGHDLRQLAGKIVAAFGAC